jgi:hypothetical protein
MQVQFSYYLEGLPINTVVVSDFARGVYRSVCYTTGEPATESCVTKFCSHESVMTSL